MAPEVSAAPIGSILEVADDRLGRAQVDAWIAEWGVDVRQLVATRAWVSLAMVEKILERVAKEGGPELVERAGRLSISPKHLGPIYPVFRALASPLGTYERMRKDGERYNKAHQITFEIARPGHVRAHLKLNPGIARPETFHFCRVLQGQLSSVPALFDRPPATVVHDECMANGAPDCVFDITWREAPKGTLPLIVPALVGLAAGGTTAFALGAGWPATMGIGLLTALASWALAFVLSQRRSVDGLVREIHDHHEALAKSLRDNEHRFAEVLEAKAGVERKVDERTAELSVTTTKLEETLLAVRELDAAKTDFFANVSHDLRTPLTMILGPLDEMREGREPAGGASAAVETMHRNAMRLLRLINQLLDLAKVDAGGTKLQRTLIDPAGLARTVTEPFAAAASARRVTIAVDVPERVSPLVADAGWIESALSNLIGNAMKFVPVDGHVTLRVLDRGHEVEFDVIDDGPGIAAADLPKIFDRFSQGNGATARRGGTGIGLAIVREAARLHGGEASIESELGKGARFSLRIPRQGATEAELAADVTVQPNPVAARVAGQPSAAVDIPAPATSVAPREGPFAGAPLAVVVEDNDEIRALIANVLASRYRVREARNGQEGLDLLFSLKESPAIVISDVSMPVMDGLQFVRAMRADARTRPLPVVMLTARRDVTHVLEAFDAGADDYVTKPFHARELLARIDVRVRLNQLISEMAHRERLATLGVLAASVAHQIRNPLTSMRVGLPLMRMKMGDKLDARSREMLDVMIDGSERMERLTTDLLDLSRVDREVDGHCHPGEGLLAAARLISARLPAGVTLDAKVDSTLEMVGRAGDLNQLFLNILDNAARAVGERGTISVEASAVADGIEVRIGDSGAGIRASIAPRVFQPFVTTRAAGEGTGLGLSIAKQIVDAHGGTITVGDSKLGGALFTIHLPMGASADNAAATTSPNQP